MHQFGEKVKDEKTNFMMWYYSLNHESHATKIDTPHTHFVFTQECSCFSAASILYFNNLIITSGLSCMDISKTHYNQQNIKHIFNCCYCTVYDVTLLLRRSFNSFRLFITLTVSHVLWVLSVFVSAVILTDWATNIVIYCIAIILSFALTAALVLWQLECTYRLK